MPQLTLAYSRPLCPTVARSPLKCVGRSPLSRSSPPSLIEKLQRLRMHRPDLIAVIDRLVDDLLREHGPC